MPIRQLFPDIFQITMPTPFAVGDVHAYLLLGEPLTLVDAGVYHPESRAALDAAFMDVGLKPYLLQRIVVSHSHLDHFGQARRLQRVSGAQVMAHPLACMKMRDLPAYARSARAWSDHELFAAGLPVNLVVQVQAFYELMPRLAQSVEVRRCLEEGDRIDAGGRQWRVQFYPGHSGDLIALYDETRGLLIGSDHLLPHISSNALIEPPQAGQSERRKPLLEYWESLERLAALDVRTILPGHGEIITDHRQLIEQRREQRDRRLTRIERLLSERGPLTPWQIAQALFAKLMDSDIFLALSEVIGHLDMLEIQGRVHYVEESMPRQYHVGE
ncbi:MAG: MBL fold metallo-hydrolase [Chloroflexi bacterium]|nr:MBL fold metallo-hydrolase [Chloroflexota bacterium]